MSRITALIVFVLFSQLAFGQEGLTSVIRGTVIDKASQISIPGANVVIVGSDPIKGASTDMDGEFRIEDVPVGRTSIQISFMGYKQVTLDNLLVMSAKELEINIELVEDLQTLKEVQIVAEDNKRESLNKMNTVSARIISTEEAVRFSGSLQDPARMAQNYAGVSGSNDARNDIIIRGNSPSGVLWRLEGIDIPSPNHFSTMGTTGGPISMLNVNNLKNSDFLTGAWSSEYGNALSGAFDLQLRRGNNSSREYLAQVGFNGFEFGAEGPFAKGKRASYLINYRYSTLGVLNALGLDLGTGAAIPQYQDVNANFVFPTKKAGVFSVWGLGGPSHISFAPDSVPDENNLFSDETQDARFETETYIVGASHRYVINERTYSKVVVAHSIANTFGTIDSVNVFSGNRVKETWFKRGNKRYTAHAKVNQKVNAANTWTAGMIGDYFDISFIDSNKVDYDFVERSNFEGGAFLLQSYMQWRHRFGELWTMNAGVHTQHYFASESHAIEPRLGMRYQVGEQSAFSLGAGMHSQMQPIVVYYVKDPLDTDPDALPNQNLDFSKSLHGVLGYDQNLGTNMRLKAEVYYQHIYNVAVDSASSSFSMLNQGADFGFPSRTGLENEGTGRNYGVELTLEQFLTKGFYYLISSSVFESKYTGSDGQERNTAFNNNYVFNALTGKEFVLNDKFTLTLDTKVAFAGGLPYTPIDLDASQAIGFEVRDNTVAFSENYDDYFRWDVKIGFRHNAKKFSQEFMMDIQNITNEQNVFFQGFKASTGNVATTYQRGFFPMALYKLYF